MENTITIHVNDFKYCDIVQQRCREWYLFMELRDGQEPSSEFVTRNGDKYEPIQYEYIKFISTHITLTGYQVTLRIRDIRLKDYGRNPRTGIHKYILTYFFDEIVSCTEKCDYHMR
jgi:hypothetical protein